ncbi:MAG TPA: nucleoside phosphorylase [Bacteroidales bacterium]|nr:nucleoside phosphorylase [Bacteroidales bacterium]
MTKPNPRIAESELIINPSGTVYHLNIHPEDVAENIILVGDPDRVEKISARFDKIVNRSRNREMVCHTGFFNNKFLTVLSTGMGTDNIDIVINELDALVNVDFATRTIKPKHTSLNIVRLGTSGAVQPDIPVDSFAASTHGIGLDGLLKFYDSSHVTDQDLSDAFIEQTGWHKDLPYPYAVECSPSLFAKLAGGMNSGITATAPGFYGPQGRVIRIPLQHPQLMDKMAALRYKGHRIINFEMETSALYGLSKLLGHQALTVCAIIANRANSTYSKDYHQSINSLIDLVLERITSEM